MSATSEASMSFWLHSSVHDDEIYKLYINRIVFIETAEENSQWMERVKRQWGFDQPIAIRVMNEADHLGTTTPQMIENHTGWTGISWEGNGENDSIGISIPSHQGPMLVLEVVGGRNAVSVYGVGLINSSAMVAEKRQYGKYSVHLFPIQTALDSETVYAILEAEIRSNVWDGRHGDCFAPLEYNFGSVRVSTLDFHFPSFMLTGTGEYVVSSVICAMNMTEYGALAMQLVPLLEARDYISVEPPQVITVKPQQRVYFTATWNLAERACMRKLQMKLVVNGSQPPFAPVIITVHNSPPQPNSTDKPYHYWLNTTCVTNRQFSLSQEFPLVFSLLPVFRFVSNDLVAKLRPEGVIVALDKDKGENVLVRADGVPISSALNPSFSPPLLNSSFGGNSWAQANSSWRVFDNNGRWSAPDEPYMNLSEKTCQCTIHLGSIRGFPMVYEVSTGISPSFQVSVTLLDQQGWQVVKGETKTSYQSASGSLRWDDQLILRKWPGASCKQFIRLNLTEVRPRDGDETPIGAALVSLYRLDRTHLRVGIQLAFHVYETYSLYDTLHSSSLLMTDAFITFSELQVKKRFQMVKANYIRAGRLVRIIRGPRQDRVGIVVDIVDANRVLVENPSDEKMWRHVQNLKNVEPLDFCVPVNRNCSTKALKKALEEKKTLEKYAATKSAGRIAAKKALAMSTDFERYQLRVAKRSRAFWMRKIFDEKDKKSPVSWHKVALKKLQKNAKKVDSKPAAKKRIEKARAARKAKAATKA